MRSLLPCALILGSLPASLAARDVYGNATPWTTNDTIIWELHQKQNAYVAPSSGQPSWQSQIAARQSQKRLAAESAARDAIESSERDARIAKRAAEYRPLTWAQQMKRYISQNGDRAAPEQEELAFYLVQQGDLPEARHHLGMVLFRKGPRAGEAAWQLYQLYKPDGPDPDPAKAAYNLEQATALGYSAGLWQIAVARYQGDAARGVPPDPIGSLPLFETIFAGKDRRASADAGRLLLAYDLQTAGREEHALTVMRRLQATAGADRISDGTLLATLLIKSPGGWEQHRDEIIAALRLAPQDGEGQDMLARIYLGLDPAALGHVQPNQENANGALRSLAQFSQATADSLLAEILPPGPKQRLPAVETLLGTLLKVHPESTLYAQRYAEVLAGEYGGQPNLPAALKIYQRLADQPNASPAILTATARLLSTNLPGHAADHVAAFVLWERAAKQWDRYAQYRYAEALFKGIGCTADPAAAAEYIEATTRDDHPAPSAYPLYTLAAQLSRKSASLGGDKFRLVTGRARVPNDFAPAQLELAFQLYAASKTERADNYNKSDPQEAFFFADRAARAGLDEARLLLARFYWEGFGTAVDLDAAQEIFTGGVAAGVPMAMSALAEIQLEQGNRFYDVPAGFALATRAAAAGDPRGHYLLGRCYFRGQGTAVDIPRAMESMQRSAAAGSPDALLFLADQRFAGAKPDPNAYAKSLQELRQAAEAGSLDAAIRLFKAIAADPSRPPERLKKLNEALTSLPFIEPVDEELAKEWNAVISAAGQIALLTGQRRDPALSYETALWMLGEPTAFAPPTGLTYYSADLISEAAQEGHHGAEYREALQEIAAGRKALEDPEEDVVPYKEGWESKHSAGRLAAGLDHLRAAAAGGEPNAIAYLKERSIDLISAVKGDEIDQAAIEKIDPAVRGGRPEGEYVLARRAMRIAREYLGKPAEDVSLVASGKKYSDAWFEEALKYFRSSAAAGVPEAIQYLEDHHIPLSASEPADEGSRTLLARLKTD
ncbi:MAG: hypothetical protein ABIZ04_01150 [Opitutus sp.]